MSIYNKSGTALTKAYALNGTELLQAYTTDGTKAFSRRFSVMSYNVQGFGGINSNEQMQKGIVETYTPDIVGLQELGLAQSLPAVGASVFSNYPYQYLSPNIANRPAIVSKLPLSNVNGTIFESQEGEQRGYQKSYFTIGGKTICWINTHLATSDNETAKVAQAAEVFALCQNETYFIVTGDFNTVCKNTSATEYTSIMKQFVDAGYNVANCSPEWGFTDTWTSGSTASGTWYPCDHIITSANFTMDDVIVDTTKIAVAEQTGQAIDHLPIIAYLTVN